MNVTEKMIAKLFDKYINALGNMTKALCSAIENKNVENRIVIYRGMECELIGTSDGGGTLNTGGLAFCIKLPDGSVENVQDSSCKFK